MLCASSCRLTSPLFCSPFWIDGCEAWLCRLTKTAGHYSFIRRSSMPAVSSTWISVTTTTTTNTTARCLSSAESNNINKMAPPASSPSAKQHNNDHQFKDKIPRGLRVLSSRPSSADVVVDAHQFGAQLKQEAAAIERWWTEPRWKHTKRIYTRTLCVCVIRTRRQLCLTCRLNGVSKKLFL